MRSTHPFRTERGKDEATPVEAAAELFALAGEGERGGVDAVAQAGGAGTVGEDVAEMAAAAGAGDLDAPHAEAQVLVLLDGFGVGGNHEAGPAAAGVELGAAQKEQRAAAGAVVVAGLVILGERAGEGALGALLAQDVILLGRERGAPLGVAADDLLLVNRSWGPPGKNTRAGAAECGSRAIRAGAARPGLPPPIELDARAGPAMRARQLGGQCGDQASATSSISTSTLRGRRETSTVVRAGSFAVGLKILGIDGVHGGKIVRDP